MLFQQIEPNIPAAGVRMIIQDGHICSVNQKPRTTIIDFEVSMNNLYEDVAYIRPDVIDSLFFQSCVIIKIKFEKIWETENNCF